MVLGETPETYGKDIDNNFLIKNTMEEKKKLAEKIAGQPQKYSYEQLTQIASELSIQNQKLVEKLRQLQGALENRNFDYTSFFLSMLFKVVEHKEAYKEEFVSWCVQNIEQSLVSFVAETKKEEPEQKKDEA